MKIQRPCWLFVPITFPSIYLKRRPRMCVCVCQRVSFSMNPLSLSLSQCVCLIIFMVSSFFLYLPFDKEVLSPPSLCVSVSVYISMYISIPEEEEKRRESFRVVSSSFSFLFFFFFFFKKKRRGWVCFRSKTWAKQLTYTHG
ncbi:hypothetical protein HMI54_008005 [Coelomomyces lativittatus]|nr:hypothetical protein HMI54_008005 [Coelomomyces lativittatus]